MEERAALGSLDPRAYVSVGYDKVDENCELFFTKLHQSRRDLDFTKDTLVSVASAAGVISGLAGAGKTALSIILGSTGLIPSVMNNYKEIFLLGAVPNEAYQVILTGLKDYKEKNPPSSADDLNAQSLVRGYARWCTLPAIQWIVATSLMNTKGGESGPQAPLVPTLPPLAAGKPPVPPVVRPSRVIGTMGSMELRSQ